MIDRKAFLEGCRTLVKRLEADLIARSHGPQAMPEVVDALHAEFQQAKAAKRTAQNFEDWRTEYATQQAAAWILSAVFVRFLEDNGLTEPPRIAGPGERLRHARDQHELYFRAHPTETDREYLLHVFHEAGKLPGGREIFGKHNNVFELPHWLSGDAAGEILDFFQRIDANSGALVHDFTDPEWDTRFLGDLYQDLSEAARKKFALLQTPEFVEEFILDRTLDPALDEFGLAAPALVNSDGEEIVGPGFRMIDPACGSGHFVLGAFRRILDRWQRKEPGTNVRELVQRALDSVHGVDINPYAIAIARFRMLIAALKACAVTRLKDAPAFHFHLAAGDSLLHGVRGQGVLAFDELAHHYQAEDLDALRRILRHGAYHAVVANPPYITVKDPVLNQAYRDRYTTCHRQYSLAIPFMERIFGLAVSGGYTGQITANSFMKREFGKKLIEQFFPTMDLTHVLDTSGAYIPGHGTPTVILFGRNRKPIATTLRTVLGIRGEPQTPDDPAQGRVWSAILDQVDRPGSQSEFVSAGDSVRTLFHSHPWSIGGGGAAELKELLEESNSIVLETLMHEVGRTTHTGEDDFFYFNGQSARTHGYGDEVVPVVLGEDVRDYQVVPSLYSVFPYDRKTAQPVVHFSTELERHYWNYRTTLRRRRDFGQFIEERGLSWREHSMFFPNRFRTPLSIVYAEVATHNHFVLDRGGKVFKQTAPVIKLPEGATEDDHLALLGLLNSSIACFWMKQGAHNKGDSTDQHGARTTGDEAFNTFAFNATLMGKFPLSAEKPLKLARELDRLARKAQDWTPSSVLSHWAAAPEEDLRDNLRQAEHWAGMFRRKMIALQEELDWQCYRLYGLLDEELTWPAQEDALETDLGQRAFEIVLARKMAWDVTACGKTGYNGIDQASSAINQPLSEANEPSSAINHASSVTDKASSATNQASSVTDEASSATNQASSVTDEASSATNQASSVMNQASCTAEEASSMTGEGASGGLQTSWFVRHGSKPIREIPRDWPEAYRQLVARRIEAIERDPAIGLIERPEYKRRWNTEPWASQLERALREWLLGRLERVFDFDGRMRENSSTGNAHAHDNDGEADPLRARAPARMSSRNRSSLFDYDDEHDYEHAHEKTALDIAVISVARLADVVRQDAAFMKAGEVYRDDPAFDVLGLVTELVEAESVPLLPVLRYKETGLRKRAEWERTWALQREADELALQRKEADEAIKQAKNLVCESLRETEERLAALRSDLAGKRKAFKDQWLSDKKFDASIQPEALAEHLCLDKKVPFCQQEMETIKALAETVRQETTAYDLELVKRLSADDAYCAACKRRDAIPRDPDIAVPPKYDGKDFQRTPFWRLRGKLDVPKERWVSFPHCEGPDGTLMIAWAGYDHLQLTRAISAYYVDVQERLGGRDDPRLVPLLACLIELLPWLKQWHNEVNPEFGMRMGDYFEGFIQEESRNLGKTQDEIRNWQPPEKIKNTR